MNRTQATALVKLSSIVLGLTASNAAQSDNKIVKIDADPWKSRLDLIERVVERQAALSR